MNDYEEYEEEMDDDGGYEDYCYDKAKDDAIMCDSNEQALFTPTCMERFLPEQYRYYLYTVRCRENSIFAKSIELWRKEC